MGVSTVLYCYPASVSPAVIERPFVMLAAQAERDGFAHDVRSLSVGSCSGIDFATAKSDDEIRAYGQQFIEKRSCRNTTFIPTRGVRLSFAILNPRKNESRK